MCIAISISVNSQAISHLLSDYSHLFLCPRPPRLPWFQWDRPTWANEVVGAAGKQQNNSSVHDSVDHSTDKSWDIVALLSSDTSFQWHKVASNKNVQNFRQNFMSLHMVSSALIWVIAPETTTLMCEILPTANQKLVFNCFKLNLQAQCITLCERAW